MGEMGARAKTIKMIFFKNVEGKGKDQGKNYQGQGQGQKINETSKTS